MLLMSLFTLSLCVRGVYSCKRIDVQAILLRMPASIIIIDQNMYTPIASLISVVSLCKTFLGEGTKQVCVHNNCKKRSNLSTA